MTSTDLHNLISRAKEVSQLNKTVIGFVMSSDQINAELQIAIEELSHRLETAEAQLQAERDKNAKLEEEKSALNEELMHYKSLSPRQEHLALKAKDQSPPNPPPGLDTGGFWYPKGAMAEVCKEELIKLLRRCSSKAQVCEELFENKFIRLVGYSHKKKAEFLNQFLPEVNRKFQKFTDSDFKKYFRSAQPSTPKN